MGKWLALAALALAGCKTVARGEIYEELIEQRLRELGHETEVDCPDAIPLGLVEDNHFDCVVAERGGETPVVVQLGASYDAWKLEAK